ncbi:hypothetical protein BU17DRAFT_56161 [Hysterangium stoloniferum]|nr:hypothetical protein BU17DRAFT_56161 [Hysterangium stoloniferum]
MTLHLWSWTFLLTSLLPLFSTAPSDSVPFVAWGTQSSTKLNALARTSKPFLSATQLFDKLLEGDSLCQFDAVIVADQPGLHATDLRVLPSTSYISSRLKSSASSLQIPNLPFDGSNALEDFKNTLSERCYSDRRELPLGKLVSFDSNAKHVIGVAMPSLGDTRTSLQRQIEMNDSAQRLSSWMDSISPVFQSYLVIYTASRPFTPESEDGSAFVVSGESDFAADPLNTTLPSGPLFARYQFLTPGLITALLVAFGLLVPILLLGIYSLASIQSPGIGRMEKGVGAEKKNQ